MQKSWYERSYLKVFSLYFTWSQISWYMYQLLNWKESPGTLKDQKGTSPCQLFRRKVSSAYNDVWTWQIILLKNAFYISMFTYLKQNWSS